MFCYNEKDKAKKKNCRTNTIAVTSDRTNSWSPAALSAAGLAARLSMQLIMADPTTTPSARPDTSATLENSRKDDRD